MKKLAVPPPHSTIPLLYSKYVGYTVVLGLMGECSSGSHKLWIKFLYVFHLNILYISFEESICSYLFNSNNCY